MCLVSHVKYYSSRIHLLLLWRKKKLWYTNQAFHTRAICVKYKLTVFLFPDIICLLSRQKGEDQTWNVFNRIMLRWKHRISISCIRKKEENEKGEKAIYKTEKNGKRKIEEKGNGRE